MSPSQSETIKEHSAIKSLHQIFGELDVKHNTTIRRFLLTNQNTTQTEQVFLCGQAFLIAVVIQEKVRGAFKTIYQR